MIWTRLARFNWFLKDYCYIIKHKQQERKTLEFIEMSSVNDKKRSKFYGWPITRFECFKRINGCFRKFRKSEVIFLRLNYIDYGMPRNLCLDFTFHYWLLPFVSSTWTLICTPSETRFYFLNKKLYLSYRELKKCHSYNEKKMTTNDNISFFKT